MNTKTQEQTFHVFLRAGSQALEALRKRTRQGPMPEDMAAVEIDRIISFLESARREIKPQPVTS